jgi:hypothetical protein
MRGWIKRGFPRVLAVRLFVLGMMVATVGGSALFNNRPSSHSVKGDFQKGIQPLFMKYCYECHNDTKHKGGFSLQSYPDGAFIREHREVWAELLRKVRTREMPPEGKPQPTEKERERIVSWVDADLFPVNYVNPDPGRVTIRRLNRAEYNNTVRDLLGIDFHPADDFPNDDTGYGFDNIGDVLSLSPLLLEKYVTSAEEIMETVLTNEVAKGRLFTMSPASGNTNACLEQIIGGFARRAFRRPPTAAETERLVGFAKNHLAKGESFEDSVKLTCEAVLVSPNFLFRGELQPNPDNPAQSYPIDEFALAARLSYFLWSSIPDGELFALAEKGKLRRELTKQIRRMLKDAKSDALVHNFAGQWLQLRNLKVMAPDRQVFPSFDDELRAAMAMETELFFKNILREDRSVMEFLTADYTFVNEPLARHYGLKQKVTGREFQRVLLKGSGRAGILTHASVLTVTSNPTRTSPVKRGKWVLENLLAEPPPPPPPNVPPLIEGKEAARSASLRERMEKHRQDPLCASCHAQMDPIGFSLENFDGIGAWRDRDGAFPIDASGRLPGGDRFSGADGLRSLLASKRKEQFLRCMAEKMLTYALGRGLEYYDRCALETIVARMERQDCRFSALIEAVVDSVPFQRRRGEGDPLARGNP